MSEHEQGRQPAFPLLPESMAFDPTSGSEVPATAMSDAEEQPSPYQQDLDDFKIETAMMNRVMPVEDHAPDGKIFLGNTGIPPHSHVPFLVGALQNVGYDISLVDTGLREHPSVDVRSVGIYTGANDRTSIQKLISPNQEWSQRSPYRHVLYLITAGNLFADTFLPGHLGHDMASKHFANLDGLQGETFLRTFMTNMIVRRLRREEAPDESYEKYMIPSYQLYETLHAQGVRPYHYEELFGIAARVIAEAQGENPDILAPYSKRSKAKPEEDFPD